MACQSRNPTTDELQKTFNRIAALRRKGTRAAASAVAFKVLVLMQKQQKARVWTVPLAISKRITEGRHTGPKVEAVVLAQFPYLRGAIA